MHEHACGSVRVHMRSACAEGESVAQMRGATDDGREPVLIPAMRAMRVHTRTKTLISIPYYEQVYVSQQRSRALLYIGITDHVTDVFKIDPARHGAQTPMMGGRFCPLALPSSVQADPSAPAAPMLGRQRALGFSQAQGGRAGVLRHIHARVLDFA